jgi:Nickel responsive protein SCO4226-like
MKFIDVHTDMKGIDRSTLIAEHAKDSQNEASEGVRFLHAWADPSSGKVFCLSEGPNKDAVLRVHQKAGHPTEEIYEVPIEVE